MSNLVDRVDNLADFRNDFNASGGWMVGPAGVRLLRVISRLGGLPLSNPGAGFRGVLSLGV